MIAATEPIGQSMRISVREARLTLDRIFLAAGVDDGLIPAVREHALTSAALGLGGWEMVHSRQVSIGDGNATRIEMTTSPRALRIDAGGLHAWLAGATILDLALDAAHSSGRATVAVRNVLDPSELAVLTALARRHGASATIGGTGPSGVDGTSGASVDDVLVDVTLDRPPRTPAEWDPVLDRALREGLTVEAGLWWELHRLSNRALSPDTVESRRHAGPIIITADGRIIGRQADDETDVSLLNGPNPAANPANPSANACGEGGARHRSLERNDRQ